MDALRTLLVATTLIAGAPPLGIGVGRGRVGGEMRADVEADKRALDAAEQKRALRRARNLRAIATVP